MPSTEKIERAFAAYDMRIRMRHKPELDRDEIVIYGLDALKREELKKLIIGFQLSRDLVESEFAVAGEAVEENIIEPERAIPSATESGARRRGLQLLAARRRDEKTERAELRRAEEERKKQEGATPWWAAQRLANGTARPWANSVVPVRDAIKDVATTLGKRAAADILEGFGAETVAGLNPRYYSEVTSVCRSLLAQSNGIPDEEQPVQPVKPSAGVRELIFDDEDNDEIGDVV